MKQSSFPRPLHRERESIRADFKKRDKRPKIVVGSKEKRQQYALIGEKMALVVALRHGT
jgi:hypothetical protein